MVNINTMNCTEIKSKLLAAITLIEDFERDGMTIDRDAAIDKIREAYQLLRFEYVAPTVTAVSASVEMCQPAPAPAQEQEEEQEEQCDEPEVEVEFILADEEEDVEDEVTPELEETPEPEPEVEETPEVESEESEPEEQSEPDQEAEPEVVETQEVEQMPEPKVIAEPEPQPVPVVETPVAEPAPEVVAPSDTAPTVEGVVEQSLFGFEPQVVRPKSHSRRRLITLYGDEPTPTPKAEPQIAPAEVKVSEPEPVVEPQIAPAPQAEVAPKPFVEPTKVLGESVESVTTIADTIVAQPSVGESTAVNSLREAITVGHKFMLIRDLFDGDNALYEKTIDELDKMDNLDDSIIYIAENFAWRPSSEGAKLIVDLLQRKYR